MGITVVDSEEEVDDAEPAGADRDEEEEDDGRSRAVAAKSKTAVAGQNTTSAQDRTDDPVRMYLREMGSVELLSREGEIAIAKRIEGGPQRDDSRSVRKPADLRGHHGLA